MKLGVRSLGVLLFSLISAVQGVDLVVNKDDVQQCSGMYSRKAWGGSVEPYILVKFMSPEKVDEKLDYTLGVVIWERQDWDLLGKPSDLPPEQRQYFCTDDTINKGLCNSTHKGEFILADNAESASKNFIRTAAIDIREKTVIKYPVKSEDTKSSFLRTGYYCVSTQSLQRDPPLEYTAIVTFRNAYGELPAAQIAKLPFYGGITIVYAVVGIFWGFLYYQHRHDILAVQNYITAILGFLVIEMLMMWGYYDYQNRHGNNAGAKALMIVVAILNAFRNSFSFFLLLIVCMGYGVVKHTLGKTMTVVRWLAVAHFLFGVLYVVASLTLSNPENVGPIILLVILPLSATLTAFYIWTMHSLNLTMKDLVDRKQHVKAAMYKKLWWCILGSIIVIFAFFVINSFSFAGVSDVNYPATHWQTRWFVLDGWLNLVYLFDVCFIAYIWRPTANNRRFAMSDEIAQDDEGFEIASLKDSFDEEDGRGSPSHPPAYDPAPRKHQQAPSQSQDRDVSPLPAPKPQKPVIPPRESLDGDTIFAVGEDDKWSDDEIEPASPSDGERARLTNRKDD